LLLALASFAIARQLDVQEREEPGMQSADMGALDTPRIDQCADHMPVADVDARVGNSAVLGPDHQVANSRIAPADLTVALEPVVVARSLAAHAADAVEKSGLLVDAIDES